VFVLMAPFRQTVTTDGDEFMLAVPGAAGRLVRTGYGTNHAAVTAYDLGIVRLGVLDVGFPAVAEAEVVGDSIVTCTMLNAPGPGTWDGVHLERGQSFVYPAGTSHHARDPAGLRFALTTVSWSTFESAALDLGFDPTQATRRHVVAGGALASVLSALGSDSDATIADRFGAERLVDAAVRTVCGNVVEVAGRGPVRRFDDADLVHEVVAFLEAGDEWMVPNLVLCRHVGVSERRLQSAFGRIFGVGPNAYMRHRALQAAHRRLRRESPATIQIAALGRSLGFAHLGRFAGYYRDIYGESPSTTLARSPSR